MNATAAPNSTRALIVGVEKYKAGSNWDLNGPALDVCRFAQWLCDQKVLSDRIALFVSPLDANQDLPIPKGVVPAEATWQNIEDALTTTLRTSTEMLLYIYWGGMA
jgi:hypothetical protein